MSENYNDDDFDFEFEDDGFIIDPETGEQIKDDGLLKFEEMRGICERHIANGHDPYNEEEFEKIVKWAEETIMNNSILGLVLDGTLDVIFDEEKLNELGEDGLLFSLSPEAKKELENSDHQVDATGGFLNLDFGEKEEE